MPPCTSFVSVASLAGISDGSHACSRVGVVVDRRAAPHGYRRGPPQHGEARSPKSGAWIATAARRASSRRAAPPPHGSRWQAAIMGCGIDTWSGELFRSDGGACRLDWKRNRSCFQSGVQRTSCAHTPIRISSKRCFRSCLVGSMCSAKRLSPVALCRPRCQNVVDTHGLHSRLSKGLQSLAGTCQGGPSVFRGFPMAVAGLPKTSNALQDLPSAFQVFPRAPKTFQGRPKIPQADQDFTKASTGVPGPSKGIQQRSDI